MRNYARGLHRRPSWHTDGHPSDMAYHPKPQDYSNPRMEPATRIPGKTSLRSDTPDDPHRAWLTDDSFCIQPQVRRQETTAVELRLPDVFEPQVPSLTRKLSCQPKPATPATANSRTTFSTSQSIHSGDLAPYHLISHSPTPRRYTTFTVRWTLGRGRERGRNSAVC